MQPRDDSFESRASLFQQNSPLADPCTFRLIAKNVTNLLRDSGAEASQKAATLQSLEALLRCAIAAQHHAVWRTIEASVEDQQRQVCPSLNQFESHSAGCLWSQLGTLVDVFECPVFRSFQMLDDLLERAAEGDERASVRVKAALEHCIACTSDFESVIKRCLGGFA